MMASEKRSSRRYPRKGTEGLACLCYRTLPGVALQPRQNIGEELIDISWGGARVKVSERVSRGDPMTVELRDHDSGEVFRARGDVRWCEERGSDRFAGIQFTEIYTPSVERERFLGGPTPTERRTLQAPADGKRAVQRFKIDDYIVTCFKLDSLSAIGLRKNIAREVADISSTGTQLLCNEVLEPGHKVFFTLHLNKFGTTLESDGVVKWCRKEGQLRRVGIELVHLTPEKHRLIDFMINWIKAKKSS